MWSAFLGGTWVDLRSGDPDQDKLANSGGWGPERIVRAEVISALLLGARPAEPGRFPGLRLRGAKITGRLDLMGATIGHALVCEHCVFDAPLRFVEATTRTVRIVKSRLVSFNGARMRTEGILNFSGSVIESGVRLDRATIAEVTFRGASVGPDSDGTAIAANGITIDGHLECHDGFTADGTILLHNARLGGSFELSGARITCPQAAALMASEAVIGGRVDGAGMHVEGEVGFRNAQISGILRLSGAQLRNPGGRALSANSLVVGGGVWCGNGFRAEGAVTLVGARLNAYLTFEGAELSHPGGTALRLDRASIGDFDGSGLKVSAGTTSLVGTQVAARVNLKGATLENTTRPALVIEGAGINGTLVLEGLTARGEVRVSSTTIGGAVELKRADLSNPGGVALNLRLLHAAELVLLPELPVEGSVILDQARIVLYRDDPSRWPGQLHLDGLTYETLQPPLPARERLEWLSREPGGFQQQPYEQLASTYNRTGRPGDAVKVLLAKERRQRALKPLVGRVWGALQDVTVAYGYQPWRAVAWLAVLLTVGSIVYGLHPPLPLKAADPPHFNPVIYTLDLLLPIVDLGQKHSRNPAGAAQWLSYLLVLAGWILATTVATGIARVLRRQ